MLNFSNGNCSMICELPLTKWQVSAVAALVTVPVGVGVPVAGVFTVLVAVAVVVAIADAGVGGGPETEPERAADGNAHPASAQSDARLPPEITRHSRTAYGTRRRFVRGGIARKPTRTPTRPPTLLAPSDPAV